MNRPPLPFLAQAFGFDWAADLPLALFDQQPDAGLPGLPMMVRQVDRLPSREVLARQARGSVFADGFRFRWDTVATFDFHAPGRIEYLPGTGWNGAMPDCFFSTVAALAAAWNGLLPLHATALELAGKAVLLAGPGGAGKSTIAAELLAHGAAFVGDDLTVLGPHHQVFRGRNAMRLHPGSAALVEALSCDTVPDDPRGKLLVRPRNRSAAPALPLAGIVLIGGPAPVINPGAALKLLPPHLFRPRWSAALPGHHRRRAWLVELAGSIPVLGLPPVTEFGPASRNARLKACQAILSRLGI